VKFKLDENLPVELVTHDVDTVIDEGLRERLNKLLEMDLAGRLTVVGPSRIRLR
jgi:hypothetical protein